MFLISGVLACNGQYLVTGSVGQFLKLWSVANICPAQENSDTQVVMESQIRLDGAIIAVAFDDNFEMVCFGLFSFFLIILFVSSLLFTSKMWLWKIFFLSRI